MKGLAELESRLSTEREKLERLEEVARNARARSEAATPGGLTGYDSAILSGVRRRPDRKGDGRRFTAYDHEAAAYEALTAQEKLIEGLERRVAKAQRDAEAPRDLDSLAAGWYIRDHYGWHKVIRVNAKSVTVETPWSWPERIPFWKVIETRGPEVRGAVEG